MVNVKYRAGALVVDQNYNTCLLLNSYPYDTIGRKGGGGRRAVFMHHGEEPTRKTLVSFNDKIVTILNEPQAPVTDSQIEYDADEEQQFDLKKKFSVCCSQTLYAEKLQIPRGVCERGEWPIITAVREFIEESRSINAEFFIHTIPFQLHWKDGGKLWTYDIFIAYIKDKFKLWTSNVLKNANSFRRVCFFKSDYRYECSVVPLLPQTFENQGKYVAFLKYWDYFKYLRETIYRVYTDTNYAELEKFFNAQLPRLVKFAQCYPERCDDDDHVDLIKLTMLRRTAADDIQNEQRRT